MTSQVITPSRGEIYWKDFGSPAGSEPGYRRPVVVVQDDRFNRSAIATCIVAVVTSNVGLATIPGNVFLPASASGLPRDSTVNLSQVMTVDTPTLSGPAGSIPDYLMTDIDAGLRLVLGLHTPAR
ncbi:MAG TPA: type II toxin-antitoxin system PemK/MazF family toxin [Terrimesophilobacter sp.]|nr:type II toxin-antitoxin system PemK/MazF family toxin [Terrimesophilobacter sp.]